MEMQSILKAIREGNFKPVYVLHGEEPYFIDRIEQEIVKYCIPDESKDFDQAILYGKETEVRRVFEEARSFPLLGDKRLVVIREAQEMKDIELLEPYFNAPNPSTVLVICHKYKALDGKRTYVKTLNKEGYSFKSEKIKDYHLVNWITQQVEQFKFKITPKAAVLLVDSIGNDLSRLLNEVEKLTIILAEGTTINDIHIEENIGISKDYNNFELQNAIAKRDQLKVFQIAHYFEQNPKDHSIIPVISMLFNFYTNLMRIHFAPNKNPDAIAGILRVHPFVAKELMTAANVYPPKVLAQNVALLHEYDLKSKGVNNSNFSQGELLREMLYQLMN